MFAEFFRLARLARIRREMAAKTIVNGVAKRQARVVVGLERQSHRPDAGGEIMAVVSAAGCRRRRFSWAK